MSDTRADVAIAKGVWVDLYATTGITVGTAVSVYNKGSYPCLLAVKATAPATGRGIPLYVGSVGSYMAVDAGESGLWAYCVDGVTSLLVQD